MANGLYVHVPFCVSKCAYCAFYSETEMNGVSRWLDALDREVEMYAGRFSCFDTMYIGGGTPSALGDADLERMVGVLHNSFTFTPDAELTLEVNPGDVPSHRGKRLRDLGFNRVSVGVQSFEPDELSFLQRRHSPSVAKRAVDALRDGGFESVGIDLIQGLPHQSIDARLRSVQQALSFRPEHLSCYELTWEEGTSLARAEHRGEITALDRETCAVDTRKVWDHLEQAGYDHYEVSNFARSARDRSRHNGKYWRHAPYLGLGPAAHSFDGVDRRWSNVRNIARYVHALLNLAVAPVEQEETLTEEQLRLERIALGFRTTRGVALDDLEMEGAAGLVPRAVEEGFLEIREARAIPTVSGLLVADALARNFTP